MRVRGWPLFFILLVVSPATASPLTGPPPPAIMETTFQDDAVHIEWQPVPGAEHYTVYRDATPFAETTATTYTAVIDDVLDVFWVTATVNHEESMASEPIIAPGHATDCEIIGIGVDTEYPFFGYHIQWHCIPLPRLVDEPQPSDFMRGY